VGVSNRLGSIETKPTQRNSSLGGKKIAMKKKIISSLTKRHFKCTQNILFNVCLREHIFNFFKKRFVFLFGRGLEMLIIAHFFEEIFLFSGKRFWGPNIDMDKQITRSISIYTRNSFVSQSQYLPALHSGIDLDPNFSTYGLDFF